MGPALLQARPSPPALLCRLPPRARRTRAWPSRAGTRPATSRLLACLPDGLDDSLNRHAAAPTALTSPPRLHRPPLALSSSITEPPSPPLAVAALRATPSPRECVQKIRRVVLFLLAEPRAAGSPATPPRRRPLPRIAGAPRRRYEATARPRPLRRAR